MTVKEMRNGQNQKDSGGCLARQREAMASPTFSIFFINISKLKYSLCKTLFDNSITSSRLVQRPNSFLNVHGS